MDVSLTTFTVDEINTLLAERGVFQDSLEYYSERNKQFRPADLGDIGKVRFVEREDWNPESPSNLSSVVGNQSLQSSAASSVSK